MSTSIKIGILTVSDRASRGEYADKSGPAIQDLLKIYLTSPWQAVTGLVPDDPEKIRNDIIRMVDTEGCCLVITSGGTGPTERDITPEATEAVCEKLLPGFGEKMRAESLKDVPTALLSRQTAGIRGKALIINLPGNPKAIQVCLESVFAAVPACVELIGGPRLETDTNVIVAYHPKHA